MKKSIKEHLQAFAFYNSTLTQEAQNKFNAILIDKLTSDHLVCKSEELHGELDAFVNWVEVEAVEDFQNTIERQKLLERVMARFDKS